MDKKEEENKSYSDIEVTSKRKFFMTPVVKVNSSFVKGGIQKQKKKIVNHASNSSSFVYKQSLKANNKSLAKALDITKQDVSALAKRVLELEQDNQEQAAKISVLRLLNDKSSEAIETELCRRMNLRIEKFRKKLDSASKNLQAATKELQSVIQMCDSQAIQSIDDIVKDTLELTQMFTPDNYTASHSLFPRSMNMPRSSVASVDELHQEDMELESEEISGARLSSVDESAEKKRKSSLLKENVIAVMSENIHMAESPSLPPSKTKRASRNSQIITHDEIQLIGQNSEDRLSLAENQERRSSMRRSKQRRVSRRSDNCIKPLEPVISAAADVTLSPCTVNVMNPQLEVISSPSVDDNNLATAVIPFDEIPVGSRATREENLKPFVTISKSRRQTQIIKHSEANDQTSNLLESVAGKFFIQLSPPKIFEDLKEKTKVTKDSKSSKTLKNRRATYSIEKKEIGVDKENDSLLITDGSDDENTPVRADVNLAEVHSVSSEGQAKAEGSITPVDMSLVDSDNSNVQDTECAAKALYEDKWSGSADCVPSVLNTYASDSLPKSEEVHGHVRQMVVLYKNGQFKVSVGSRDGKSIPMKKSRKKSKAFKEKFNMETKDGKKDPYNLSLSDTLSDTLTADPAVSLKEFNEKQKQLNEQNKENNKSSKQKELVTERRKHKKKYIISDDENDEECLAQTDNPADDDNIKVSLDCNTSMSDEESAKIENSYGGQTDFDETLNVEKKNKVLNNSYKSGDSKVQKNNYHEQMDSTNSEKKQDSVIVVNEDKPDTKQSSQSREVCNTKTTKKSTKADKQVDDDILKETQLLEAVLKLESKSVENSPVKRSRRASANINFKEPSLNSKLRKGDPGTCNIYGNSGGLPARSKKKSKKSVVVRISDG